MPHSANISIETECDFLNSRILELHQRGYTPQEIASRLETHRTTVWRRLQKLGLRGNRREDVRHLQTLKLPEIESASMVSNLKSEVLNTETPEVADRHHVQSSSEEFLISPEDQNCQPKSIARGLIFATELAFLLVITLATTWFLVNETSTVFKSNFENSTFFALLIEGSIVGLSFYNPKKILKWIASRLLLLSAMFYSLASIGAGVLSTADSFKSASEKYANITSVISDQILSHEREYEELISRERFTAARKVAEKINALRDERKTAIANSPQTPPLQDQVGVAFLIAGRALIMLMNSVFCSILSRKIAGFVGRQNCTT